MPTGPAAVLGDKITGTCVGHQVPGPPTGNPVPAPPMPFSAPVTMQCATQTLIANKPAVLVGSSGLNTPPHVGLHASDPFMVPAMQRGTVTAGSATVLIENKPAVRMGDQATMCMGLPGQVVATASTVIIGG